MDVHTYSTGVYGAPSVPGTGLGSAYHVEREFSMGLSHSSLRVSEAQAVLCSGPSLQGCLWNKWSWRMEKVFPSRAEGGHAYFPL